ncbi:caspase, EACC1-associated type [Actinoplanes awajinensis]|uniref:caspase, EACC1-associated type n=1 Tax=Actinoplanes awajinensis TaxID=135946 RepID=UPI0009FE9932|nr:caspase family protein [Actinoplanes awajinensis]
MRLPEFSRSQAVIFGTAEYKSDNLENLHSVARNVQALYNVLTDARISGFPRDHCITVINPRVPNDMLLPLKKAAKKAEDALLVYFSGHGLLASRRHELHLALAETETEDDQFWTSVPFRDLEEIVLGSSAEAKIVILDCCYSGRAVRSMSDPVTAAVEQLEIEGLYIITSCSGTKTSLAPENDEFSAFTGCMLDVMMTGVPHPEKYLPMDVLYEYVTKRMSSRGFQKPQQRAGNTAGKLALVRNIYIPASHGFPPDETPPSDPSEQSAGIRISRWREHRRFSPLDLAQLLGRPESWVRQVESGQLRLDEIELSTVLQISDALSIDLPTLLDNEPVYRARGFYSIDYLDTHEIRSALERDYPSSAIGADKQNLNPNEFTTLVNDAWRLLDNADYGLLSSNIPRLLRDVRALETGPVDFLRIAQLRSQIYLISSSVLRKVGEHELSWLAADRASSLALQIDDSLLLGATIVRVSGALLSLGRVRSAFEICLETVAELRSASHERMQAPDSVAIRGALLLQAAIIAARMGDAPSVRDLLKEAEDAGRLLGGEANHFWTSFGPTTIEVYRAAAAVELGDGRLALQVNESLGSRIDTLAPCAQGSHFLTIARAALQSRDLPQAIDMLLETDRRVPSEIICRPVAHEIIADVLRRSRSDIPARLIELADHIGLAGA